MKKTYIYLLLLGILFFTFVTQAHAGGGVVISGSGPGVVNSKNVYVRAQLPTTLGGEATAGNRVEFFVWNKSPIGGPESTAIVKNVPGITCTTTTPTVGSTYTVTGSCSATEEGMYSIGLRVYGGSVMSETGKYNAIFTLVPLPTSTPKVTTTPTPMPTAVPTVTPKPTLIPTPVSSVSKVLHMPFDFLNWLFHFYVPAKK